jgi:hypothetical protein
MDAKVLQGGVEEPSTPALAAVLLVMITSTSEGKVDPKFEKFPAAVALLQENPQ